MSYESRELAETLHCWAERLDYLHEHVGDKYVDRFCDPFSLHLLQEHLVNFLQLVSGGDNYEWPDGEPILVPEYDEDGTPNVPID